MRNVAYFIGGPWDLHKAALPDYPLCYRVALQAQPEVSFNYVSPSGIGIRLACAMYDRTEVYDMPRQQEKVIIYIFRGVE